MLYELLAGRPPFLAMSYLGLVTQHINTAPPSLTQFRPDLPGHLVNAVHKALEKDPAKRFQSAAEFARALPATPTLRELDIAETLGDSSQIKVTDDARAAAAAPGPAPKPRDLQTPPAVRQRRRTWIGIAAALLVAAGVVVAVVMMNEPRREPTAAAREEPQPPAPREEPRPPAAPAVVTIGKLDVRTDPPGAKVYVDDVYKGPSPVLIAGIPAGVHDVRLEQEGRQTVAMTLETGSGVLLIEETMPAVGTRGSAAKVPKIRKVKRGSGSGSGKVEPVKQPEPEPVKQPEPKREPDRRDPDKRPGQKPNPYE
jgi:hypothetical protein